MMYDKYPFVADDSGRSKSKRPRQYNDCTVKALSKVTGYNYDYVYDELKLLGRKSHRGFHIQKFLKKHKQILGSTFNYVVFNAEKDKPRVKVKDCLDMFYGKKVILRVSKHVIPMIDGTIYDWFDNNPTPTETQLDYYFNKCVYCAFIME